MKPIRWSIHARLKAAKRELEESEVALAISQPHSTAIGGGSRRIFMRRYFDAVLSTEMLLRVVVEETDAERVIVTLYKTSKFKKYQSRA